jgi:hypothetical protein
MDTLDMVLQVILLLLLLLLLLPLRRSKSM